MFSKFNTVQTLQKQSGNVLDIFRKTIESLKDINNKVRCEKVEREEEISRLQSENTSLDLLLEENANRIEKLNAVIS